MGKVYCYFKSASNGYDVCEYTHDGRFIFYRNYKTENEAYEAICKLSK